MWKKILKILGIFILGFIIGILINIPSCNKQTQIIKYVPVHDTIEIEKERIVEKTKVKYVNRIDTFYVTKSGDTIQTPELPIEHKEYKDTISTDSTSTEIQIQYHGFNAGIDQINLQHNYYNQKEIIAKEPKKVGFVWYIGFDVGFGGHADIPTKQFGWGPQAGIHAGVGLGGRIK